MRFTRFLQRPLTYVLCTIPLLSACAAHDTPLSAADSQAAHIRAVVAAGGVVDSILPLDEQLRRFRTDAGPAVDTLRNASPSIDALVQQWALAIAQRDTAMLSTLTLSRGEFAWLYYPGSKLTKVPYEAPPQLLWGQIVENSTGGAKHVLERFGGQPFVVQSVHCGPPDDTTDALLVRSDCMVHLRANGTVIDSARLFGSIVEQHGRFKFLGYANSL